MQNTVDTLVLPGFSIGLKDFVVNQYEGANIYITDAQVKSDEFDTFLSFYLEHNEPGKYFNVTLNSKGFYGRFGQLVYSESDYYYAMRLVFVESAADIDNEDSPTLSDTFVPLNARFANMVDVVAKQEIIINQLKSVLETKEILTPAEIDAVFTVGDEDLKNKKFEQLTKVKDLYEYLIERKDTLNDIKKSRS